MLVSILYALNKRTNIHLLSPLRNCGCRRVSEYMMDDVIHFFVSASLVLCCWPQSGLFFERLHHVRADAVILTDSASKFYHLASAASSRRSSLCWFISLAPCVLRGAGRSSSRRRGVATRWVPWASVSARRSCTTTTTTTTTMSTTATRLYDDDYLTSLRPASRPTCRSTRSRVVLVSD